VVVSAHGVGKVGVRFSAPRFWFINSREAPEHYQVPRKYMKKTFYITCFTFLGYLLQQLLHSLLEIFYIGLLTSDFSRFGFGFSWNSWYVIHLVFTVLFVAAGLSGGFWQGKYWWGRLYNDDGSRKKWVKAAKS
jgi:hypothetical protein